MKKNESGQALILVLLSLSVVLTLVLYIVSRSVTDIAVSSQQEESVRAFSAAEAGIEKALVVGSSMPSGPQGIGDSSYVANVSGSAQGSTGFAYPISLSNGDSATFWLAEHDTSGNLTATGAFTGTSMKICWGDAATAPAIEVTVYYETTSSNLSTVQTKRWAYDANAARAVGNSFTSALGSGSCTIAGQSYAFQETLTLPANLLLARVRMFYNGVPQNVGIDVSASGKVLPSQGQNITSTGTAGGSNRKISVSSGWAEFPFASNAIFVPGGITKP
jgi:Tfp pilus assembly protein PilX